MTTKKQRERERRYRRHGVDRPESPQRDPAAHAHETEAKADKGRGRSRGASRASGRKPTAYPTLRRALVRAPIFGIIWFVLARFMLKGSGHSIDQDVLQTLILTVVMVPLLFGADTVTYRLANRKGLPVQEPPADGWLGFRR